MEVGVGSVVLSTAGRDAGRLFVVTEIVDEAYVFIADGSLRRVEKPKKKKIKHLKVTDKLNTEIKRKLENKEKVSNAEIRKYLKTINNCNI